MFLVNSYWNLTLLLMANIFPLHFWAKVQRRFGGFTLGTGLFWESCVGEEDNKEKDSGKKEKESVDAKMKDEERFQFREDES